MESLVDFLKHIPWTQGNSELLFADSDIAEAIAERQESKSYKSLVKKEVSYEDQDRKWVAFIGFSESGNPYLAKAPRSISPELKAQINDLP